MHIEEARPQPEPVAADSEPASANSESSGCRGSAPAKPADEGVDPPLEPGSSPVVAAPGSPSLSRRVFLAATTADVHLRSMRPLRTSLEDVFIEALEGAGDGVA